MKSSTFVCAKTFAAGLLTDGSLYFWGKIEDDDLSVQTQIFPPPTSTSWTNIFCGRHHMIAVTDTSDVYVWGDNKFGQLGLGREWNAIHSPHILQPPVPNSVWTDFACGGEFVIGKISTGDVYVWGINHRGQLGIGDSPSIRMYKPQHLPHPYHSRWDTFVCGEDHTIGTTLDKKIYIWGSNYDGQLGLPNVKLYQFPHIFSTPVEGPAWESFFCGPNYTIGALDNGDYFVWGKDFNGHLGLWIDIDSSSSSDSDSDNDSSYSYDSDSDNEMRGVRFPQLLLPPPDGSTWVELFCGDTDTFGITSSGEAYAWGNNASGQLGLNAHNVDFFDEPQIVPHPNNESWIQFYCADDFTIAVDSEQKVFICGRNQYGQSSASFQPLRSPCADWDIKYDVNTTKMKSISDSFNVEQFSDLNVGGYHVHSALLSFRCPLIMELSERELNESISSSGLLLLFKLIYGTTTRYNMEQISDILSMNDFVHRYNLVEYMNHVSAILVQLVKVKKDLVHILLSITGYNDEGLSILFPDLVSLENMVDAQKFIVGALYVRNANHPKSAVDHKEFSLQQTLQHLFETGHRSDLTIVFEETRLLVHRFILVSKIEYFDKLLQPTFKESKMGEIDFSSIGLSFESMKKYIEYIYCGSFSGPLSPSDCVEILVAQNYFACEPDTLTKICNCTLAQELDVGNCLQILSIAYQHRLEHIIKMATTVVLQNIDELVEHHGQDSKEWKMLCATFMLQNIG